MNFLKKWLLKRSLRQVLGRLEKAGMLDGLKKLLASKKALALIVGILTVVLQTGFGLDPAFVDEIVKLVMTYLGAQGIVDVALVLKNVKN